jgi:hypothetical protein
VAGLLSLGLKPERYMVIVSHCNLFLCEGKASRDAAGMYQSAINLNSIQMNKWLQSLGALQLPCRKQMHGKEVERLTRSVLSAVLYELQSFNTSRCAFTRPSSQCL